MPSAKLPDSSDRNVEIGRLQRIQCIINVIDPVDLRFCLRGVSNCDGFLIKPRVSVFQNEKVWMVLISSHVWMKLHLKARANEQMMKI
jgi:hypothetical protein